MRSIQHAIRKRPVEPERVERMVNGIVRRLESSGETEIPSTTIGELVMQGLSNLDTVAYVRFASVYKNFREAKDFENIIGQLNDAGRQAGVKPTRYDEQHRRTLHDAGAGSWPGADWVASGRTLPSVA